MNTKYIFVTGGVISGLGKGITAASLGRLLKNRGYKVTSQKLDPYINVDPGTMSPYEHGEVFVTDDGAETDLDLGHYERFIDENLNKYSNLTTGKLYWNVLNKERQGSYLGQTVQVIPHVTNEIQDFIFNVAKVSDADVVITEIGGTVGDIESQPFLEAIRQVSLKVGKENCLFIHVTLVPYLHASGEHKSKPTQHSVKELRSLGITPDIIVTRSDMPISDSVKHKISLFCNVERECVIENMDISTLYEAPIMLERDHFSEIVCKKLNLPLNTIDNSEWMRMLDRVASCKTTTRIALVGKYVQLHDAYISIVESLKHAGWDNGTNIDIKWIDSEELNRENAAENLSDVQGIIVPGGFGNRGIEGMIAACEYARVNNVPYFGICLGMQIAVIEFARHVLGYEDANSKEFDENTKHNVIDFMPDQNGNMPKGGTMRLGAYPCKIKEGTLLSKCYGEDLISERHRHRYEFNNEYREEMISKGLTIGGTSEDERLVESVELDSNDFFIGVQYHPEFKSRPNKPQPIFREFIKASLAK